MNWPVFLWTFIGITGGASAVVGAVLGIAAVVRLAEKHFGPAGEAAALIGCPVLFAALIIATIAGIGT